MAKLDDIKSQAPDSRLSSLGTTFRPGKQRIALPTSKHSDGIQPKVSEIPELSELTSSPSTLQKSDSNDRTGEDLTRHNSTQLSAKQIASEQEPTRHNSTQPLLPNNAMDSFKTEFTNTNSAQLDTQNDHLKDEIKATNSTQNKLEVELSSLKPAKIEEQTRHNPTQLDTGADTTRHTHSAQPDTTISKIPGLSIERLSGISAKILSFLAIRCLETNTNIVTISYEMLAIALGLKEGSMPTTCKRLKKLGYFAILGPGGGEKAVRIFKLDESVLREFSRLSILKRKTVFEITAQLDTTRHTNSTQPDTCADTTPSSKLVSTINNNLLTTEPVDILDISEIELGGVAQFNITRKQIQDIKNQKLNFTTSSLQDFIDRFAIYVAEPKNIKGVNSLKGLFVKMAQLASKGEDPLCDIETPADRLMRERLERLNAKREEHLKLQTELMDAEFENWCDELKAEGREHIVPPTPMMKSGSIAHKMNLKVYFIENIWPNKAAEIGL